MLNTLPVYVENASEAVHQKAQLLCAKWGFERVKQQPTELGLCFENEHLVLKDFTEPKQHGVAVDFLSAQVQYRKQYGGAFKEPLVKAFAVKSNHQLTIIDATPGLGRDAFVLASVGCRVILVERSPVVAALLADGIARLVAQQPEMAEHISLIHGDSISVMQNWSQGPVDGVYLDPMFPHRKKSALVKKEMRVFQQLLGHDLDADNLLTPAKALARSRVVVKRPNSAPVLAGCEPSMAITSKKHRFDVYLIKTK
ncbi:class I SAM-dependent methyltransferase [Alteromonas sp. ASW11-130]|uniref:class I SAM-dependent methyltransferase n=1 Tax=Alteromonas sp. ASW11-130 TaxID=3015775 RepID=UPI002241C076|nr:class I SAM-dependent methyltransferase [Alteromonas sp. ASW11-130]MCW8091102.1 class I SAM-dependent methyltransferase [Alteromonas sp. ASW11-130]